MALFNQGHLANLDLAPHAGFSQINAAGYPASAVIGTVPHYISVGLHFAVEQHTREATYEDQ